MQSKVFLIFFGFLTLVNSYLIGVPVVTEISRFFGPPTGGTQVEITGSGFTGATQVEFGGVASPAFFFNSDTSITAFSPIHSPETVFVTVTTPDGTSSPNEQTYFVYQGHWQVYVGNRGNQNVMAIDATTNQVTAIPRVGTIGDTPVSIGMTPDGMRAYVTNYVPIDSGSNNVVAIDTAINTFTSIPSVGMIGFQPSCVAVTPDGRKAYVTNQDDSSLAVITVADNSFTTISLAAFSGPFAVAITPDSTKAYVSNLSSNNVNVIDTLDDSVIATIGTGNGPTAIAITPDGTKAYVTLFVDAVGVIDTANNAFTSIPTGGFPSAVAITPDGKTAYVVDRSGNLIVINTSDNSFTSIPLGGAPTAIAITPDGQKAYVVNFGNNNVAVINTADNRVITTIPTGTDPASIVITPDGKKAYVANQGDNDVAIIDTTTNTFVTIPVGNSPSTINITPDQAPLARFTASLSPSGFASLFDASSSLSPVGDIIAYSWNFGDGTLLSTASPIISHSYREPGSYLVTLTVTNSGGTSTSQIFNPSSMPVFTPFDNPNLIRFIGFDYLSLTNNGGPSATTTQTLTILPPSPFVQNVSPSSGPTCGGTVVTITGINFTEAIAVFFGSTPAAEFTVQSDTTITATTPPGASGTVDVSVIAPSGTSTLVSVDQFTYLPPPPPRDLRGYQVKNRFATQRGLINVLRWKAPSHTCGCAPVAYRIYRDPALKKLVGEVSARRKLEFSDPKRRKGKAYSYFIVSVDRFGNFSRPAKVVIKGNSSHTPSFVRGM